MAIFPIITGAETEVLHNKAQKVKDPKSPEIAKLIEDMFDSMHAAEGMGLAAPQINISLRVAVIEFEKKRSVYINPVLTAFSSDKVLFEEGCLSLPQEFFWIERSTQVTVRYQDEHGNDKKEKLSGIMAIAIQHEIDHLEGTLIIDRYRKQKVHPLTKKWS
jgi:peptide deformylase